MILMGMSSSLNSGTWIGFPSRPPSLNIAEQISGPLILFSKEKFGRSSCGRSCGGRELNLTGRSRAKRIGFSILRRT
jgi:hypothetical protein